MACIKCGKKTEDGEVFCAGCKAVMEQYPVKQELHIQLPNRPEIYAKPAKKRRPQTAEERVIVLRRKVRRLKLLVIVLVFALGISVYLLTKKKEVPKEVEWGTNYSTVESTE